MDTKMQENGNVLNSQSPKLYNSSNSILIHTRSFCWFVQAFQVGGKYYMLVYNLLRGLPTKIAWVYLTGKSER
jgi:hypothetical protein